MRKAFLTALGLSLFSLSVIQANATQRATIVIDGESSDWQSLIPAATDPENDSLCPTNTDLKHVYTAIDDHYAYGMVETHNTPISSTAILEINFDYKDGQHFLHDPTSDIHLNVSETELFAWNDNELDSSIEPYPITGHTVVINNIIEFKIPLSELENATYFDPTFVNLYDDSQQCDLTPITPPPPPAPTTAVNFSNWTKEYIEGDVNFSANGTTLEINAVGTNGIDDYVWGNTGESYSDAVGLVATFNVSSTGTNDDADIGTGLRKRFAYTENGNLIEVQIYLSEYQKARRVQYRIRERTPEGEIVKTYSRGIFGDYSATPWDLNQDIIIGFAAIGDTLAFYCAEYDFFVIYKFTSPVHIEKSNQNDVFAYASINGPGSVTATAKDFYVLTEQHLLYLSEAGFINGDIDMNGKLGLEDIISSLRFLSGN